MTVGQSGGEDHDLCALIPVRILQHIQDFGVLIAIEKETGKITHVSENGEKFFEVPLKGLLGQSIFSFGTHPRLGKIVELIGSKIRRSAFAWEPVYSDDQQELLLHDQSTHFLFEWIFFKKKDEAETVAQFNRIVKLFRSAHETESMEASLQHICKEIKETLGFDKILIYHFRDDGHGDVVAEAKEAGMAEYFGLRFPKSDVPPQVRELYLTNPLRMIQNAKANQAPIVSIVDPASLDLSSCLLKGIAPVHQEYTQNMGIATSISAAIIFRGGLWGLVCCHHLTPREFTYQERLLLLLASELLSTVIEYYEIHDEIHFQKQRKDVFQKILELFISSGKDFVNVIMEFQADLLGMLRAGGMCIYFEHKLQVGGKAPPREAIEKLIAWLAQNKMKSGFFVTESLADHYSPASDFMGLGAGIFALNIGEEKEEMVIFFRPEQFQTVRWGGDPNQKMSLDPKAAIHPRRSFAIWKEEMAGKSVPWFAREIEAGKEIRDRIQSLILRLMYVKKKVSEAEVYQLTLATNEANEGVFILSPDQKIVWTNRWFVRFLQSDSDIRGRNFFTVLKEAKVDQEFLGENELQMGKEWNQEVVFSEESDKKRYLLLKINSYRIELTGEERFIGVASDITELKRAAMELASLNKQKDDFIRMAAHDLRNPLSIILAATSVIQNEKELSVAAGMVVDTILRQGQSMLNLLNELLNVSVIQSAQFVIKKEKVDLLKFFQEICNFNTLLAHKKQIYLESDFKFEVKDGEIDPNKIKQVVDNLLSNAIKYSSPKTKIILRVLSSAGLLRVEVEDHGLGIPPEEHGLVFKQFAKLSPKPTGGETSNRLGLAICRQIILAHGGEIGFKSVPKEGSTFYFTLPLIEASLRMQSDRPLSKVLMIDDDPDLLEITKIVLSKAPGLHFETALTGKEGVAKAVAFMPDLILLDLMMPELDGHGTLKALRAIHQLDRIPVIFLTANSDLQAVQWLREEGAFDVMIKPYDPAGLIKQLTTIWQNYLEKMK